MAWIDLNGFIEVNDGSVKIALPTPAGAAVEVSVCIAGLDLYGLVVVRNGFVKLALAGVSETAIEVGRGVTGIELDGFGEGCDSCIRRVHHPGSAALYVICGSHLGLALNGPNSEENA
jgi:hypothetical protein